MTGTDNQDFISVVLEAFARLDEEGYTVTDVRPNRVEYSKTARRVVVTRSGDGEIDVALGSRSNAFGFDEFMHYCVGEREYRNATAPTSDAIRDAVENTAARLFEYPNLLALPAPPSEIVRAKTLQFGNA